jgi:hypothetical protein
MVAELENQQKLWQWLIVAVLGFVIAETALAGYLAPRVHGSAERAGKSTNTTQVTP